LRSKEFEIFRPYTTHWWHRKQSLRGEKRKECAVITKHTAGQQWTRREKRALRGYHFQVSGIICIITPPLSRAAGARTALGLRITISIWILIWPSPRAPRCVGDLHNYWGEDASRTAHTTLASEYLSNSLEAAAAATKEATGRGSRFIGCFPLWRCHCGRVKSAHLLMGPEICVLFPIFSLMLLSG
jgi:hypothetical protein